MKPVGQLDHNDADILCHGDKHLPEVIRLKFQLILIVLELFQLRYAIDDQGDVLSELLSKLLRRHHRILNDVMQ